MTQVALAHSGRTDASGCHNDYQNGGYHCHNGGNNVQSDYDRGFQEGYDIAYRHTSKGETYEWWWEGTEAYGAGFEDGIRQGESDGEFYYEQQMQEMESYYQGQEYEYDDYSYKENEVNTTDRYIINKEKVEEHKNRPILLKILDEFFGDFFGYVFLYFVLYIPSIIVISILETIQSIFTKREKSELFLNKNSTSLSFVLSGIFLIICLYLSV